jgi:hypothetical protein
MAAIGDLLSIVPADVPTYILYERPFCGVWVSVALFHEKLTLFDPKVTARLEGATGAVFAELALFL